MAQNPVKYSVVMPVLNGAATLAVTLPEMLKIDRDDIEWVISNNHSDDQTEEVVRTLADERVVLVHPPQRLPAGKHLEFTYQQASGKWQGHLGDDDILFPSRFEIFDSLIDQFDPQVIIGEDARYTWPDYPKKELANTLDARHFTARIEKYQGQEMARTLINQIGIPGGGSWIAHQSVIQAVRQRAGYFGSPQHEEFFALRSACVLAQRVVQVGLPFFVAGRHEKSSGTQVFRPKEECKNRYWDWQFEDPDPYRHSPFQYKGYVPLSLDAALLTKEIFQDELTDVHIDWPLWLHAAQRDIQKRIQFRQLPPDAMRHFTQGLKKVPPYWRHRWNARQHPRVEATINYIRTLLRPGKQTDKPEQDPQTGFGWSGMLQGQKVDIQNITDVPGWIENTFHGYFNHSQPQPDKQLIAQAV